MSENHKALIAWLKTSPDPFGNIALDPSVIIAAVKALLQICPDPNTKHLAYKALNTAKSAAHVLNSTEERVEIAYQLVRISVSRSVR